MYVFFLFNIKTEKPILKINRQKEGGFRLPIPIPDMGHGVELYVAFWH
jgi:hypothetical protein